MKLVILFFVAGMACMGSTSTLIDFLLDEWLNHAREMMNASNNRVYTINGVQFYTNCGAFITDLNCTVKADVGLISDMSTLTRMSPAFITSQDDYTEVIQFSLGYNVLKVHYPNMIIEGEGINMVYRGINTTPDNPVLIRLVMTLDYSNGVDQCTNTFQVNAPPPSSLQVTTTIDQPRATLPRNNDLTQGVIDSLLNTLTDHVTSLISYEKVCTKLANLL